MKNKSINLIIVAAFTLFLFLHHWICYIGHYGYDDMEYAQVAANLLHGVFDPTNHFTFRLTLIGLTSVFYFLFGINDFASSLPSLLATTGVLWLIFYSIKHEKWPIVLIALTLTALDNWTLFYSDKLMSDSLVTFFAFGFIMAVYSNRTSNKHENYYALLAALSLFLCFNTKGTVVLLAPLALWFIVSDFLRKQHISYWIKLSLTGMGLLVLYFVIIHFTLGDALSRFKAISSNSYLNRCSYDQQPFIITIRRIGYYLWKEFLIQGMFTGFFFVLAALPFFGKGELLKMDTPKSFWVVTSIILMLSSNFMTISPSKYIPMCIDPRHYMFTIPANAMAATFIWKDLKGTKKFISLLLAISTLAFALAYITGCGARWLIYFPVLCAVFIGFVLRNKPIFQTLFPIMLLVSLLVYPIQLISDAQGVQYRKQKEIIKKEIIDKHLADIVVTDEVQKRLGNYFSKFSGTPVFLSYAEADTFPIADTAKAILLTNPYTQILGGMTDADLPYYARMIDNPIFTSDKPRLTISKWEQPCSGDTIFHSSHSFEAELSNWNNNYNLQEKVVFAGKKSQKVDEYSATLNIPLDTVFHYNREFFVVEASAMVWCSDESNCSLVISIGANNESSFWKGVPINKYMKSYGEWWPMSVSEIFRTSEIKKNSTLSLYFWNYEKDQVYIDNFDIKVISK